MTTILEAAMRAMNLDPETDNETGQVRAIVGGNEAPAAMGCTAMVDEERSVLVTTAIVAQPVPLDRIEAIAEFALRINRSLIYGSLDVDLDGGWIQFRGGLSFGGTELSQRLVQNALREVVVALNALLDPLVEIIEGRLDARAAWQQTRDGAEN